jgi:tetratricopeptide (TPR) repeat protein
MGAGLIAVLFAIFFSCRGSNPPGAAAAANSYVDSGKCAGCHPAIARAYARTGMARSFSLTATLSRPGGLIHRASQRHYEVLDRAGSLTQRRYEGGPNGSEVNAFELQATYSIGSGNHARTYLHRTHAGEIFELPLTLYTEEHRWDMSPGFDTASPEDFTRLIDDRCLFCHNGYPRQSGEPADGIDCQRCHGPGARHIELASQRAAPEQIDAAIVNPARLSAARGMDVCAQCHLETTSAELPSIVRRFDRGPFSFRPGEPLGDYEIQFDKVPARNNTERFEVVGQGYRLRASACYLRSQGRLTCLTCHNPHVPASEERYRDKCLTCHATVTVAGHPALANADCISCHMPRRRTQDAIHIRLTDHWIQRRPAFTDPKQPIEQTAAPYRGDLEVYYPDGLSTPDREVYLGAALITGAADRKRGIDMLSRRLQSGGPARAFAALGEGYLADGDAANAAAMFRQAIGKDPALVNAHYDLGQALEAVGQPAEARAEYEQAIRMRTPFPEAEFALGNLFLKSGDPDDASVHLRNAILERPVYAEAHVNLGNLYMEKGNPDGAAGELEQALRIDPSSAAAHNSYARVLAVREKIPEALEHARRAVALDSGNAEAHYNLAQLLSRAAPMNTAIPEYRKAIGIRPDFVEARLALGQALGDAGHLDEAIGQFEQVLRLRPAHAEAQKDLDMARAMKARTGGR